MSNMYAAILCAFLAGVSVRSAVCAFVESEISGVAIFMFAALVQFGCVVLNVVDLAGKLP